MRFEHPVLLWLLLALIPGLAVFFWWTWRQRQRLLAQFVASRLLSTLTASVSPQRKKLKLFLLGAAVVLLWITLARPQYGFTWEEARSKGLDVIVAIDVSKSMLAGDLAPNRLKRAQLAALDLRRLAATDRLGLVAFAGSSFLQCPLSLDDEAFRQSLDILDTNIIPQGGTALSEAILSAQAAFKDKGDNHRVLVIFTDGEDHDGSAIETAKAATKEGLRIFTIGVGTPNGELIRLTDAQGRTDFLKDEEGNAVKSRLNEDVLKELAEATGGFYMRLSGANTMEQLYQNGLSRLPKSELASQRVRRYHERYQWLLVLAMVLLLAEMFVPERKPRTAAPASAAPAPGASAGPGPAPTPASAAARTALFLLAFLLQSISPGLASTRDAYRFYQNGRYVDAMAEYELALKEKENLNDPRLHFNLAAAAYQAGQFDRAHSHFLAAVNAPDVELQQKAFYNLGSVQYRMGEAMPEFTSRQTQWEEAVKSFRSATALRTNDANALYNLRYVEGKLAEMKEWLRRWELARREAEQAQRRHDYGKALEILEAEKTRNPAAQSKEVQAYVEKLKQIHAIAPQKP